MSLDIIELCESLNNN